MAPLARGAFSGRSEGPARRRSARVTVRTSHQGKVFGTFTNFQPAGCEGLWHPSLPDRDRDLRIQSQVNFTPPSKLPLPDPLTTVLRRIFQRPAGDAEARGRARRSGLVSNWVVCPRSIDSPFPDACTTYSLRPQPAMVIGHRQRPAAGTTRWRSRPGC